MKNTPYNNKPYIETTILSFTSSTLGYKFYSSKIVMRYYFRNCF